MVKLPEFEAEARIIPIKTEGEAPLYEAITKTFATGEKAFAALRESSLKAERYMTANDVVQNATRMYNDSFNKPDANQALEEFKVQYNTYHQTVLDNTDRTNRPYVEHYLITAGLSVENKIRNRADKQNFAQAYVVASDELNKNINEMQNSIARGDFQTGKSLFMQAPAMIKTGMQSGLFSSSYAASVNENLPKIYYGSVFLRNYETQSKVGKGDAVRKELDSKKFDKVFSRDDKEKLLRHFDAIDKQNLTKLGINRRFYTETSNQLINNAKKGGLDPFQHDPNKLALLQAFDPENYPFLLRDINDGLIQHAIVQNEAAKKYPDMVAAKTKLEMDSTNEIDLRKSKILKDAATDVGQHIKQIEADPVSVYSIGEIDPAKDSLMTDEKYIKADQSRKQQMMNAEIAHRTVTKQKQMLIPEDKLSVMSNVQARGFVDQIESASPKERIPIALNILKSFKDEDVYYAGRDLQNNGLKTDTTLLLKLNASDRGKQLREDAYIAWTRKDDDYAPLLKSVEKKLTPKKVKQEIRDNKVFKQYYETLIDSNVDGVEEITQLENHGALLAMQLMTGPKNMSLGSAVDTTVRGIFGDQIFLTDRGRQYFIPSDINESEIPNIKSYLRFKALSTDLKLTPAAVRHFAMASLYGLIAPGKEREIMIKRSLISLSYVSTSNDKRSLILRDAESLPILDINGNPIQVSFQKLKDPESEENKQMHHIDKEYELKIKPEVSFILKNLFLAIKGR